MEPRLLLEALMAANGDNANSLAASVQNRTKQPQIFRFLKGVAAEPKRSTLQPLAEHYGVTVDVFYEPALAQRVYDNLKSKVPLMEGLGQFVIPIKVKSVQETPISSEVLELAWLLDQIPNRMDRFKALHDARSLILSVLNKTTDI